MTPLLQEPWHQLEKLVDQNEPQTIYAFLEKLSPIDTARAIAKISNSSREHLLTLLEPTEAAAILQDLPESQAAAIIEKLPPREAADIIEQIPESTQADILSDVKDSRAEAILDAMPAAEAQKTRELMQYPEDTAGGLMETEFLSFPAKFTVRQALEDLQANSKKYLDYHVQYAYVVSEEKVLEGVLRIRDLPLSPPEQTIQARMNKKPIRVEVDTQLQDILQVFNEYHFLGIPVVDHEGVLVGVLHRDRVAEAAGERDKDSFLKASGIIGGEELRSMPFLLRTKRRFSWLIINIFLNIIAASVIAFYQDTLASVIALAVFLPIISDMSGCSGSQAMAVSIRELTLGIVKPFEYAAVLLKEISIGIFNGILLGAILGLLAFFWKGNFYLGIVVGGALALNTIVAVSVGGILPLGLKAMRMDPALASGPILTTITDMCGFFFALSFAAAMLPLLS